MSTGTCPRCGEECVVRHRGDGPPEPACPCAERSRGPELAADLAIVRVAQHAPDGWLAAAVDVVADICRRRSKFTTDDIWDRVGEPPEPRAMGAVMRQAQRDGLCETTGSYEPSRRVECHGRPVRVWRSLLFGGRAISECLYCGGSLEGLRPEAKFDKDVCRAAWHREHPERTAA